MKGCDVQLGLAKQLFMFSFNLLYLNFRSAGYSNPVESVLDYGNISLPDKLISTG